MSLDQLHDGIDVPEYAVHVPWLISREELFGYVPKKLCSVSQGDWPKLRFTLLGVTANYAFNFVTHPERRLLGVELYEPDSEGIEEAFRATSVILRKHLGDPNTVDLPDHFHLMWRDDRVWVNHRAEIPEPPAARSHSLSIHYHAGMPRAWIGKAEPTLAEVKRLLNLMPGVEVTHVGYTPDFAGLGLAINSLPSLARLTHAAWAANIRFQLGIDEYRDANCKLDEYDPTGIQYCLHIPGRREPEPGGYVTTLHILGIYLAHALRERGLLGADEAEQLIMKFNNHEV